MKGTLHPEIVSRRSRPAKAPLSRDLIVSTALDLLQRDGLAGLSLRRIATLLDTGAASLYVYVANLGELHTLMLDHALAAVKVPTHRNLSWRDRLKELLRSYLQVLFERNGLAQIAMSTISTGPNSLQIWEQILALLKEGKVDDLRAAWGVDLLTLYVTAIAAEQSNWQANNQDFGRVKNALAAVSADDFPLVFASREKLISGDGNSRREWALDAIIDGICGAPASGHCRKQTKKHL